MLPPLEYIRFEFLSPPLEYIKFVCLSLPLEGIVQLFVQTTTKLYLTGWTILLFQLKTCISPLRLRIFFELKTCISPLRLRIFFESKKFLFLLIFWQDILGLFTLPISLFLDTNQIAKCLTICSLALSKCAFNWISTKMTIAPTGRQMVWLGHELDLS